jgi:hypothetical protein
MASPCLLGLIRLPVLVLFTAIGIAACSAPASPTLQASGARTDGAALTVTLVNDGASDMTGVKVTTGEGVAPIEVDRLAAGGRSEARAVSALHSYPIVTVTTNGKQFTAHPIEGFIEGWNPSKAPGQYLIRLKVAPEYQVLDVRVELAQ